MISGTISAENNIGGLDAPYVKQQLSRRDYVCFIVPLCEEPVDQGMHPYSIAGA
ncbi:MAG: hypothetical protein GXO43_09100 [Crenarchaeota archaeon]|nr:hypothetical protein [Thermoproteota archaeon]